jgi:hypothetical protein
MVYLGVDLHRKLSHVADSRLCARGTARNPRRGTRNRPRTWRRPARGRASQTLGR